MVKRLLNKKVLLIVALIAIVILGIIYNSISKKDTSVTYEPITTEEVYSSIIVVQINGEVMRPGVYEINAPARVYDLINLAGGFTSNAETNNVNLVAWLTDGTLITIEKTTIKNVQTTNKISINNATLEELQTLPQIGPAKAQAIIAYREKNGLFTSIEQLLNVNGISMNIYTNIKDLISL